MPFAITPPRKISSKQAIVSINQKTESDKVQTMKKRHCGSKKNGESPTISPENTTPTVNDVLCGHGSMYFNHIGNRRFRVLVEINIPVYEAAGSNRNEKTRIIHSIIDCITKCDPPGRFLKKNNTDEWIQLSKVVVQDKVGQTFREERRIEKRKKLGIDSDCKEQQYEQKDHDNILHTNDEKIAKHSNSTFMTSHINTSEKIMKERSTSSMSPDSSLPFTFEEILALQQHIFVDFLHAMKNEEVSDHFHTVGGYDDKTVDGDKTQHDHAFFDVNTENQLTTSRNNDDCPYMADENGGTSSSVFSNETMFVCSSAQLTGGTQQT